MSSPLFWITHKQLQTSPPIKKHYPLKVVDCSCSCALSGIMTLNKLPHRAKWVCFILGQPKSTVSLWERFDQRMNGADFKGSDNFQPSCTPFYSSSSTLHPPLPRFLSASLKVEKKRWLVSVWKDNLLSKSNKPVSTLPMPPYPFLLSFVFFFPLPVTECMREGKCTNYFKFCFGKTFHFLSILFPPARSLFF